MSEVKEMCRCGKEIMFIEYNGRKQPVVAQPRKVYVRIGQGNLNDWALVNGYESHFADCKYAKEFRKR